MDNVKKISIDIEKDEWSTILDNTLIIDNESFINNKANYTVKLISKKNI